MALSWLDLDIDTGGKKTGTIKVKCPKCQHTRKKNKSDAPLSVNLDENWFKCHHCVFRGNLKTHEHYLKVREKAKMPHIPPTYSEGFLEFFKKRGISEETIKAHFIYERQMWMPGVDKGQTIPVICFPYFRDNNLVNVKFRGLHKKTFMQIKKDDGSEKVFYGLNSLGATPQKVTVVEGEMDLLALKEAGYDHVLSVPEGAPSADSKEFDKKFDYINEEFLEVVRNVKTFYLAVDDDDPGRVLQEELARRLGKERCRKVSYPDKCKDMNDVLIAHGASKVRETIDSSTAYPVSGIIRVSDVYRELGEIREKGFTRGLLCGNKAIDRLWSIKPKLFTVITGHSGSGKSTFLDWYLVQLIKNNPKHHIHVGCYSPEDRPIGRKIAKLGEKFIGKDYFAKSRNPMSDEEFHNAKEWINNRFTFIQPDNTQKHQILYGKKMRGMNTLENVLELAKVTVQQDGANIIVLDPWNKMEHSIGRIESETNYISRMIDLMMEFGDMMDCSIILIAHPTKGMEGRVEGNLRRATMTSISGSAAWKSKPDTGLILHRDKYKANAETGKVEHDRFAPNQIFCEKQKFEEIGEEGFTKIYMDVNQGCRFVSDLKNLAEPLGKRDLKQLEVKLDEQIEEEAEAEVPF